MSTYSYFELQEENLSESPEFQIDQNGELSFHKINLNSLVEEYGSPLKITLTPIISRQIKKAKQMFSEAMSDLNYKGSYTYCYCTKSSHFSHVLNEVLKNNVHIETSSAFDLPIIERLYDQGKLKKDSFIVCNGFKRPEYTKNIIALLNSGYRNLIPVLDNINEFETYNLSLIHI